MGNTSPGTEEGLITVLENQSNGKRASTRSAVRGEAQPALCSGSSQQPACSLDAHSALRLFGKTSRGKAMLSLPSAWETAKLQILSAWMQKGHSAFIPSLLRTQTLTHCIHTSKYEI